MRIRVDFEVSSRAKRALKIIAAAVVVLGASVALANVPNTFKDGDPLAAQTMNDNFTSLDQRLAKLEAFETKLTSDGGYSTAATYCGATASTPGDLSNLSNAGTGAVKAKAACVQACTSSPTAHMCTGMELERSSALGMTTGTGYFAAGAYNTFAGDDFECVGWTSTTHSGVTSGDIWNPGLGGPSVANCTTSLPVLCCD
ncbi:MAG TPA: hypothetical protein VH054_16795 [Polyangiaceae bacterium]|jgi:hypothetical protein|nr:hypothetical protein [Polyangiaceae bacterium]